MNTAGLSLSVGIKEPPQLRMMRPLLVLVAGQAGNKEVPAAAWQLLSASFSADPSAAIHPDVRGVVYALSVMNGEQTAWDAVRNMYLKVRQYGVSRGQYNRVQGTGMLFP
jgi:hypothetical protein